MVDESSRSTLDDDQMQVISDGKERGNLRIFLGYAAGSGKTYAMLEAAQQRLAEGADVVVGYVDTHERPEANTLLNGLEVIPRRQQVYRDVIYSELDTEAIIERHPKIVLIDELAHRNGPNSNHPMRYQDVEDLLDAGIDVYSTVNVEHIESLNDVVAQITGIRVQQTIPDRLIDEANQIELIDILPEELLQRLTEGKVHVPQEIERTMHKFYRTGNLTALRELALRQIARRVDHQMRTYMQTQDIPGPWAASERVLVCISPNPISARLVRTGCRLSQQLDAEWNVVYVEDPTRAPLNDTDRAQLNQTMKLAEGLGARVNTIIGPSVANTLLNYARQNNITKIIIGQPLLPRWQELLRGSIVNNLIRQSGPIDVYVINSGKQTRTAPIFKPSQIKIDVVTYLQAASLVLLATLAGALIHMVAALNPANLVMFYLLAVVIVALRFGYGPSVVTAILSVVVFNFFFVPPQYTFRVADAEYLLTFMGLFGVGIVVARLTSRTRNQNEAAQHREHETAQLYALSRELSATVEQDVIVRRIVMHVQHSFHCDAALYLPITKAIEIVAQSDTFVAEKDGYRVAKWAFEHKQAAGKGTETIPNAKGRYIPLVTAQRVIGVLTLYLEHDLSLEQQRLLDAFATQSALALEAVQLGEEAQQARLLREKEKLQAAVLNSISHDLRTPLVSITGTLSSLLDQEAPLDDGSVFDLLTGAYSEAERLNRLVGNLLDMSRLEAGSMKLKWDLYDLSEVIGVARSHLREQLNNRQVIIDFPPDLPMIPMDLTLMAQVFVNLLDNAVKYSEPDTPIKIRASHYQYCVKIAVIDEGIGIPESDLPHIFDKFYRAITTGGQQGTGLGLSICQGIVEAHGGNITVKNHQEGGTCFQITLPLQPERLMQ